MPRIGWSDIAKEPDRFAWKESPLARWRALGWKCCGSLLWTTLFPVLLMVAVATPFLLALGGVEMRWADAVKLAISLGSLIVVGGAVNLIGELFGRTIAVSSGTVSVEFVNVWQLNRLSATGEYHRFQIVPAGHRYARIEFRRAGKRVAVVGATKKQANDLERFLMGVPEPEVVT